MVSCGTITVEEQSEGGNFDPAATRITSCQSAVSSMTPGGSFNVDVTISNDNPYDASATIRVTVGGTEVGSANETVQSNGSSTVTIVCTLPSSMPTGQKTVRAEITDVVQAGGFGLAPAAAEQPATVQVAGPAESAYAGAPNGSPKPCGHYESCGCPQGPVCNGFGAFR